MSETSTELAMCTEETDRITQLEAENEALRRERDQAVETRENANTVSVRVEAENARLRMTPYFRSCVCVALHDKNEAAKAILAGAMGDIAGIDWPDDVRSYLAEAYAALELAPATDEQRATGETDG